MGRNLILELLAQGHQVRSLDLTRNPDADSRIEVAIGDICDPRVVAEVVDGIDTVFHTAAVICLLGGRAATSQYREHSFAVNVEATQSLVSHARDAGVSRLVYTSSNTVVMGDEPIVGGNESLPYTTRFADLYTETKVVAERLVLQHNGSGGLLTCAVRPSGIWGPGDQTMFRKLLEAVASGQVRALIGSRKTVMDYTYIGNLVHAEILAANQLGPNGRASGQAYFITDGEPVNVFEFARPVVEACGQHWPRLRVPGGLVRAVMTWWQWLHFRLGVTAPPLEPQIVTRLCVDNYYSIDKARRDLGYEPMFTREQGLASSLLYYTDMFKTMKHQAG